MPVKPFLDHLYLKTEKCIRLKILVWAPGLFLESSGNFSGPESHSKMSNLRVTELFYSRILNMNRGSLHTRSFRRIHFSVCRNRWSNLFTGPQGFWGLGNWGPFLESPGNVLCPERQSKISNLTITEPFYSLIFNMNGVFLYTRSLDTDELKISLKARKVSGALISRNGFQILGPQMIPSA